MQRNWIGKSIGAEINFPLQNSEKKLKIFTTRPDTIYGASFIAVSINHKIVNEFLTTDQIQSVKKQFEQIEDEKEKIGVPLNANCIHPLLPKELPIYIANFVLDNYGEGAIFGCPAHDERDFEFAKKYNLEIIKVIDCKDQQLPYTGDGIVVNSPLLNGLEKDQAITKIIEYFVKEKIGTQAVNYKLRDWGVSRQRYWGCPIPVIYYEDGSYRVLEKDELPVLLPYDVKIEGQGNALNKNDQWRKLICSKTNKPAFERNRYT